MMFRFRNSCSWTIFFRSICVCSGLKTKLIWLVCSVKYCNSLSHLYFMKKENCTGVDTIRKRRTGILSNGRTWKYLFETNFVIGNWNLYTGSYIYLTCVGKLGDIGVSIPFCDELKLFILFLTLWKITFVAIRKPIFSSEVVRTKRNMNLKGKIALQAVMVFKIMTSY